MGKTIDKSTLGYLDIEFQYKLAKCFIEDPHFFGEVSTIVDQNAFTDSLLRTFVGTLKDYYYKESVVPSYETIGIALKAKAKSNNELQEWTDLIDRLHFKTSLEGYTLVKDTALKFFKQQNLIKVANKILEIAGKGDIERYDECQKLLDDAALAGQEDEFGFSPYDLEEKALSPSFKVPIPTGISKLDEALNGGLEKKKIGIIIGSAGFGKSTFSTCIASHAATYKCDLNNNEGYKVLQIYFEDDDVDVARKHFSKITQVEARKLTSSQAQIAEVRQVLDTWPERELMQKNLKLKPFLAHTKTASDIGIFIKRLINTGWKPDLVIIDYFECLKPERDGFATDSEWSRQGNTIRRIENLAKELDVAIWVPTQGNKDSITSPDLVTMDQAGGSIIKVQAAHVVISIARSLEDIDNSRATLAVLKNRAGKSGTVFHNIKFDNGTSTISCDEVEEFDNSERKWSQQSEKLKTQNYRDAVTELTQRAYAGAKLAKEKYEEAKNPTLVDTETGEVLKGEIVEGGEEGNLVTLK
jgi:replicative DNA helicase